nr:hypothetical protein [Tanacetum cinerariifolium]
MSDSEHSSISYTSETSPVEDYSDIGSPEVDAPLSSNYVTVPKEPEQAPLSPDYVPGPEEPEQAPPSPVYLPYPLPVATIPTADLPGYIPEFNPNGDPEEDPIDYPVDSTVVDLPVVDHVSFEEVTKILPQIPSPSLPIPSPPPDSPTYIDISESCLPLWKRLRFASPTLSQEETTIMYGMMEEAQDDRSQLRGRVNLLYRDRPVHRHLAVMIERLGWVVSLGDYPWMLATMHIQMLCHYVLRAEVELLEPEFELQGSKMVEMGQFG